MLSKISIGISNGSDPINQINQIKSQKENVKDLALVALYSSEQ